MVGKLCMVTGATSGIGAATASLLAEQGADIIIVGQNEQKCLAQVQRIRKRHPGQLVDHFVADLSSQKDIRKYVDGFKKRYKKLDVLINNAGARVLERRVTKDGYEMTFALNHLACFLLTHLLLDVLSEGRKGRIINVSSHVHQACRVIDFENLNGERGYDGKKAYAQSKLANVLFTYELARRLNGSGMTVNAFEPGNALTRFSRNNGFVSWMKHVVAHALKGDLIRAKEAAKTSVYLAASHEVEGVSGKYFSKGKMVPSSEASYDKEAAQRLWAVSLELTGLSSLIR